MKPLKIKYAKAVCLSMLYIAVVFAISIGTAKLCGKDLTADGLCMTFAFSAILLHFMGKEDNKNEN